MKLGFAIPRGWEVGKLEDVAEVRTGVAMGRNGLKKPVRVPYLRVANVQDGYLDLAEIKTIEVDEHEIPRYSLQSGDVLMNEGGDFDKLGRGHVWRGELPICLHQNHVFAVRPEPTRLDSRFLNLFTGSFHGKRYFLACSKQSTNLASMNSTQLKAMPIPLPPLNEQLRIAEVLGAWDEAIEKVGKLIEAKQKLKRGLMQQLLTGHRRFPQFNTQWRKCHIGDLANEVNATNGNGEEAPVLSCTKHHGLVLSEEYFGRRVHAEDTSGYKVVRRGQFAYATNHIEEGSIGLLTDRPVGLVSPMYTVFEVRDQEVLPSLLYRILKTERYRREFEARTNGSVNRRGGLRWSDFSKIPLTFPAPAEQAHIEGFAAALTAELTGLNDLSTALMAQKRGLMQKLLTGQIRLRVVEQEVGA